MGIIASGIGFNYLLENFADNKVPYPVLKINHYPIPKNHINRLVSECKNILVLEEGAPFIEELLKGLTSNGLKVRGRLDGTVPRDGELNPNIVAVALGKKDTRGKDIPAVVTPRPPSLCEGCPHIDSVLAINEVMKNYTAGRVFSDIGCYTLSALPPYQAVNSCVDMGASITMAKGAADAGLVPAIAVIGDSTFSHSGITGLLDAVNDRSPITVFILDNATVAMTGGQTAAGTGKLEGICKGVGVEEDHIKVISPLKKHHEENVEIVKKELAYNGVSVIIPRRECVETTRKKVKEKNRGKAI
jgi:indolepyruvate ferredoxin oxidoreductase alpha subunit